MVLHPWLERTNKLKRRKYSKNPKDRNLRTQPNAQLEDRAPKNAGIPSREYAIDPSFQKKAFRDLKFGSVTVKLNPAGEISEQADPYAVLNSTNPIVDATYAGSDNTSGSIIPQLANGSTSTFSNVADSLQEIIKINLYYCKLNPTSNADTITDSGSTYGSVNNKMMIPYQEILNTISAEAFYDLPFFKWGVKTGSTVYSKDPLLDVILNYQIVIQAVASVPLRYRVIRSLEKHLKDMCYMNGAQRLNALFGRLKKSAFINLVKSVSESLLPHYLDNYWFSQVAMLVAIPCRKSNSMLDPLIDIIPEYDINDNLIVQDDPNAANPKDIIDFSDFVGLIQNINEFVEKTSPQYLLSMARNELLVTNDINTWVNGLTDNLDQIISYMDNFTKDFADLLVAFKRMSKVGVTEWKLGNYVSIDKLDENYQPKFNKLIYDIVKSFSTGATNINYNPVTNKWETLAVWDKYLGINSYDYKSGGCVLTFSTHTVNRSAAPQSVALPVLYYGAEISAGQVPTGKPEITVLTRQNNRYTIKQGVIGANSWTDAEKRTFGRMMPLTSNRSDSIMYPSIDISSLASEPYSQGWLQHMVTDIFGYSQATVAANSYNRAVSPDTLCMVDVEIDDQTNAVETFTRQHSPFRVVKATYDNYLGFTTKK